MSPERSQAPGRTQREASVCCPHSCQGQKPHRRAETADTPTREASAGLEPSKGSVRKGWGPVHTVTQREILFLPHPNFARGRVHPLEMDRESEDSPPGDGHTTIPSSPFLPLFRTVDTHVHLTCFSTHRVQDANRPAGHVRLRYLKLVKAPTYSPELNSFV